MCDLVAIGPAPGSAGATGSWPALRQVHRPDRLAELEPPARPRRAAQVLLVAFSDLRTKWRPADPTPNQRSTR